MNGVGRERSWLNWIPDIGAWMLGLFGLEGGRINNRTAQVVFTMVCVVGIALARSFKIPLVPPMIFLDFSAVFLYLPVLTCSWIATIPIIASGGATGGIKMVSFIGLGGAVQLAYFASRFLEKRGWGKYRLLAVPIGSFSGTLIAAVLFDIMGLVAFEIGCPIYLGMSAISTSICLATVPVICHFLRKKGLI